MHRPVRSVLIALSCLLSASALRAQAPVDPSGHWEGVIQAPQFEIAIEVDLAKNAKGDLVGTYSRPSNNLHGFPLTNLVVDGRAIGFELKASSGNTTFQGILLADGRSMSGDVSAAIGSAPFALTRTGEARIAAVPKSAAVARELEGTWAGTLAVDGRDLRLVLRMSNHADGTATGTIVSVDQGGLEFPLSLAQKAATLTLSAGALGGDFFAGDLNPADAALVGTFRQGAFSAPLTFRRAAAD